MTTNQRRFVFLSIFACINFALATAIVPDIPGRADVWAVLLICLPTVLLAWWWSERFEVPLARRPRRHNGTIDGWQTSD